MNLYRNIFAYTEPGNNYPGYVSINWNNHLNCVSIAVRAPHTQNTLNHDLPTSFLKLANSCLQTCLTEINQGLEEYTIINPHFQLRWNNLQNIQLSIKTALEKAEFSIPITQYELMVTAFKNEIAKH